VLGETRMAGGADSNRYAAETGAFRQDSYLYMVNRSGGHNDCSLMQFYLQASVVEKGVTRRQYKCL